MRLTSFSTLVALSAVVAGASAQAQVTIGTANSNNCIPIGCEFLGFNQYQQVYGSSAFTGSMFIDAITLFHTVNGPGSGLLAPGTYNVFLGTTTMAVNGLSASFAANETSPLALFTSLVIPPGTSGAAGSFTIPGTAFLYNPANGNLLLDVQYSNSASGFNTFFDADASGSSTSRALGVGDVANLSRTGLVTRFDGRAVTAAPEPASIVLVATGLIGIAMVGRRRSKAAADGAPKRLYSSPCAHSATPS